MAYSTESDLLKRITQATLVQLTDTTDSGLVDSTVVDSAITDADALIDSMVSPVYQVPLANVPPVIRDHSATIAIYSLHLYRSVDPSVWKNAYDDAIEFLRSVAEGRATLEGTVPEPPSSANASDAASFTAEDRKFSRTKLKEW